jgi:catechol 2,3-dioxygenase-like lactoylglutathione lyase family enzyme
MIRFAHTNIITDDWRRLADFYIEVFNCKPVLPERDLQGDWLDRGTNVPNAHISGIHLALPGCENSGPTLEILQYDYTLDAPETCSNRKGYGHLAFKVNDVKEILTRLLKHGGTQLGDLVETEISNSGYLTFVYAKDIDGNIVEIQNWKKTSKTYE